MKSSESDVVSVAHTPGPWQVSKADPCKIVSQDYGGIAFTPCDYKEPEMSEADARLIAAAPDLLSACIAMLKDNHELGELSKPVANMARAAIHKAGENYHD